ncbi:nucleoside hydrolase [Candidatus Gottesmanbacteria bacterium]|nr:nucleoside hydrolase [Candidatus Gottesmanbacteria bacterium]
MKPILYIDTDAGVDDIVAICMIIAADTFDVRGISIVNGVASVSRGIRNLSRILPTITQSIIPLYSGINQTSQNSSVQFPPIDRIRAESFALFPGISFPPSSGKFGNIKDLQKSIAAQNESVTFLCLGPLSNIAYLLQNTSIRTVVRELVIMGGAVNVPGIVPPRNISEYNFRLDAVAANMILRSSIPKRLIPIDATKKVPATMASASKTMQSTVQMFFNDVSAAQPLSNAGKIIRSIILNNTGDFQNFYDPLAAATLLSRTITCQWHPYNLSVSTKGYCKGKVLVGKNKNTTQVPETINAGAFYSLMIQSLQ